MQKSTLKMPKIAIHTFLHKKKCPFPSWSHSNCCVHHFLRRALTTGCSEKVTSYPLEAAWLDHPEGWRGKKLKSVGERNRNEEQIKQNLNLQHHNYSALKEKARLQIAASCMLESSCLQANAKCHRWHWKGTLEQDPACFSQVNVTSPALRSWFFLQLDLAVADVAQHQEEG